MATTSWSVVIGGTTFTSHVMSMQFNIGRQTIFDDHSGGQITITLRNNTNQCAGIRQGETIFLNTTNYWWVSDISFNEGVTDAEATCTIHALDSLALTAQYACAAGSGYSTSPTQQMYDIWQASGIQPPYLDDVLTATTVVSGTVAEDTTILNRFSTLMISEMGSLVTNGAQIQAYPYSYFKNSQYTFGRSGTAGIPYYDLTRMAGTSLSANNVIIDYVTNNATYQVPFTAYKRTYRRYTVLVDVGTTYATNQARFLAEALSDPTTISGELSWTDKAATTVNNNTWMSNYFLAPAYMATLEYKIPGASATSTRIKIEGVSCNATPEQTNWTVYFTDGGLYDDYILDTNAGTLGVARFGWQP